MLYKCATYAQKMIARGAVVFRLPPSVCNIDGTALSGPEMLPLRLGVAKLLSSARYHGDREERRSEDVGMRQSSRSRGETPAAA